MLIGKGGILNEQKQQETFDGTGIYIYISIVALSAKVTELPEDGDQEVPTYSIPMKKGSNMFMKKWQRSVIADYDLKLTRTDQYTQRYENDRGDFLTIHDSGTNENQYRFKYVDAKLNGAFDSVTTVERRIGNYGVLGTTIFENSTTTEGQKGRNSTAYLTDQGKQWMWNDAVNQRAWLRYEKLQGGYDDATTQKSKRVYEYFKNLNGDETVSEINRDLKRILFK